MLNVQLGAPASFNGGFSIEQRPSGQRPVFGPFDIDAGRQRVMHSASGYVPTKGAHVRESAFCATCHTLYTTAHAADGRELGRLPEQVPFLEWKHSGYTERNSCQSCHMPAVSDPIQISSVLGITREGMGRHDFRGGNFFILAMLNRYRGELGVTALPSELETSVRRTITNVQENTARLTIEQLNRRDGRLEATVFVSNLTGHKFPTAYPSRRAWLHVTLRDRTGTVLFESGALAADGSISGNANDSDATAFEPHHATITSPDQVQVYESIMHDAEGRVTTGLLSAVRYAKDNRLLPSGFEKATAHADIAVLGHAADDADFQGGGDRVKYMMDVSRATGPLELTVELRFQPVSFRWARNLTKHDAEETNRFVAYYDAMAAGSSIPVVTSTVRIP
jgi:hypothetical protein